MFTWSWRDDTEVKNFHHSCRGPELDSQQFHEAVHEQLLLQLQGIHHPLLSSTGTTGTYTNYYTRVPTHVHDLKSLYFIFYFFFDRTGQWYIWTHRSCDPMHNTHQVKSYCQFLAAGRRRVVFSKRIAPNKWTMLQFKAAHLKTFKQHKLKKKNNIK